MIQPALPLARTDDPDTSHLAARSVNTHELERRIRAAIIRCGPLTDEQIAREVGESRWAYGTIVGARRRAGTYDTGARRKNGRGRWMVVWDVEASIETVQTGAEL